MLPSPADDPDVQEALSRRYSADGITLLQLRSGRFAVFNAVRELCGVIEAVEEWPPQCWRAPAEGKPKIDLKELNLL